MSRLPCLVLVAVILSCRLAIAAPWMLRCGDCDLSGGAPTILDALDAALIGGGIAAPVPDQLFACDINASGSINVLDALRIAQVAAGMPQTLTCPNGAPTCAVRSPAPGGPYTVRTVEIILDVADVDYDPVTVLLEYSSDAGITWQAMLPAPSSPTLNPDVVSASPGATMNYAFEWDGSMFVGGGVTVDMRATVSDAAQSSACAVAGIQLQPMQLPSAVSPVVFVLDHSCSMGMGGSSSLLVPGATPATHYQAAQAVTIDMINSLTPVDQFSVIVFDHSFAIWSGSLEPATFSNQASAVAWLRTFFPAGGTSYTGPVNAALTLGAGPPSSILFLSDGMPNEGYAAVTSITAVNQGQSDISTVGFGATGSAAQILQDIASLNGGVYFSIP